MAPNLETFSMSNGVKVCELYSKLDAYGKFLFFNSVRRHVVGYQKRGMADGNYVGAPIKQNVCRTKFQGPDCYGCRMLKYHNSKQSAEK